MLRCAGNGSSAAADSVRGSMRYQIRTILSCRGSKPSTISFAVQENGPITAMCRIECSFSIYPHHSSPEYIFQHAQQSLFNGRAMERGTGALEHFAAVRSEE